LRLRQQEPTAKVDERSPKIAHLKNKLRRWKKVSQRIEKAVKRGQKKAKENNDWDGMIDEALARAIDEKGGDQNNLDADEKKRVLKLRLAREKRQRLMAEDQEEQIKIDIRKAKSRLSESERFRLNQELAENEKLPEPVP